MSRARISRVFPTLVGVFPSRKASRIERIRLPHARGGVSLFPGPAKTVFSSSPRSWGCFRCPEAASTGGKVFPTLVGVFPPASVISRRRKRLPHARGGVSHVHGPAGHGPVSSPRSWGCFHSVIKEESPSLVFPTLVGVFPPRCADARRNGRLPHARGGVSVAAFAGAILA